MSQRPHFDLWREACDGVREVRAYSKEERDAYFNTGRPIPPAFWFGKGQQQFTTQKSIDAIYAIASDWRAADPSLKKRIHEKATQHMAAQAFGECLAANYMELWDDEKAALAAFKVRLKEMVEASLRDADHYFPCRIVDSPEAPSFAVGPVRFLRRGEWLDHVAARAPDERAWTEAVKAHWATGAELPELAPRHKMEAEDVIEVIADCQWIAVVHVKGNGLGRSEDRAKFATRLALDALGLVMNAEQSRNLRGPGDVLEPRRTGKLSQFDNLGLNTSSHLDMAHLLAHPPHAQSFIDDTQELRDAAGWAIGAMVEIPASDNMPVLRQQWCDALHWFGDARRDPTGFNALVRYGICLDVLTGGGTADGIAEMFACFRGGKVDDALLTDGTSIKKVVQLIYNEGRSRISHGTRVALLNDLPFSLPTADQVALIALERYLIYLRRYTGPDTVKDFLAAIPALVTTQKGLPPKG